MNIQTLMGLTGYVAAVVSFVTTPPHPLAPYHTGYSSTHLTLPLAPIHPSPQSHSSCKSPITALIAPTSFADTTVLRVHGIQALVGVPGSIPGVVVQRSLEFRVLQPQRGRSSHLEGLPGLPPTATPLQTRQPVPQLVLQG